MASELFIGLMSGTSLDGVDAVLVDFSKNHFKLIAHQFLPYSSALRLEILALQQPNYNELEQSHLISNKITLLYTQAITDIISKSKYKAQDISAIGCHGQTIRHRPELGFTIQIMNAALLAENTGINVVHDFRSRDIAAGGQGAPLVPGFHQALFAHPQNNRVILNIGGIANITYLPSVGEIIGFDSGPGNMLMDAWAEQHIGTSYDANGDWASTGSVNQRLLTSLLAESFFKISPPKSTGRDLFNLQWLALILSALPSDLKPQDIQRTLLELTALSIANAVRKHCKDTDELFVCGGGVLNCTLMERIKALLAPTPVKLTSELKLGQQLDPQLVEASAFAWLAYQTMQRQTSNIISVTGAKFARILGSITYF